MTPVTKEFSDAYRRFSSADYKQTGSIGVCAMQGSAGENEPGTAECDAEDSVSLEELWETFWTWYFRSLVVGSMILTAVRLLQNDDVRLMVLHRATQVLGNVARTFGGWAIQTEKAYYDVAESIPH